jgi:hypothetical protein
MSQMRCIPYVKLAERRNRQAFSKKTIFFINLSKKLSLESECVSLSRLL